MLMPNWEELVELRRIKIPLAAGPRKRVSETTMGGHRSLFKGKGLDFAEFREYAPGDDIRFLDWRVTARTGKPHVKLFTEERERSVYVIADVNAYMQFGTRRTFKNVQLARAAALLLWIAHQRGDKAGSILFGSVEDGTKVLPAKKSRRSIWETLDLLTKNQPAGPAVALKDALTEARRRIPQGSSVFILSDFFTWDDSSETELAALAEQNEVTLVKVSDPADAVLPELYALPFAAGEEAPVLIETANRAGQRAFRERARVSENALRECVARLGLRLVHLSTADDATQRLLTHLHPRAAKGGDHE